MAATKCFMGQVACCSLNKSGRKEKYFPYGISNYIVSDSYNGTAFDNSS